MHKLLSAAAVKPKNLFFHKLIVITGLLFFSLPTFAQGDLLLTPKRIVFDGTKKSFAINLANIGQDTTEYSITFVHNRMKEDGSFETIKGPDSSQKFADDYLSYYPRRVKLAPNKSQTIRIQIKNQGQLEPGEYRSNLYFRAVPNEKPLGEKIIKKDSSISIKLVPIYGISIPIIIQSGVSTAKAGFSDVAFMMLNDTTPVIKVVFNRTGNMSVYGDVAIDFISAQNKISRVCIVKGIAVYTPNNKRLFTFKLNKVQNENYHSGKLHLVYAEPTANAAKLAEAEILLH